MAQLDIIGRETLAHLARFPYRNNERLVAYARRSPRIAQLAFSHPVAFFALATGYGPPAAREEATEAAIEGRLLSRVSAALGLPLCLRRLPPEACRTKLAYAGWSIEASKTLAPFLPSDPSMAHAWLACVTFAARAGDEAIALWVARQHRLFANGGVNPRTLVPLIMFAWYSRQRPDLMERVPRWHPSLELGTAVCRASVWIKHLKLHAEIGPDGIADGWIGEGAHRGYLFVPLTTPRAIIAEAQEMNHCVVEYGEGLARGICRLFSIREEGRHIATLEVRLCVRSGRPLVVQMKGHDNKDCPLELWHAARAFVEANGVAAKDVRAITRAAANERFASLVMPYRESLPESERRWAGCLTYQRLQEDLIEIGLIAGENPRWLRWS